MKDFSEKKAAVLVIDDEPDARTLLSRILAEKFEVHTAASAAGAEEILNTTPVEIVVCDHNLGGEDGISFLTRLRNRFSRTQRILITGYSSEDLMLKGINEARLFRFLCKPVSPAELLEAVDMAAVEYDIQQTMTSLELERDTLKQELNSWQDRCKRVRSALSTMLRDISAFLGSVLTLVLVTVVVTAAIALAGLAAVYVLKSVLGINVLEHMHLEDVLRRILPGG